MYPISDDDILYPISDDEIKPIKIPSIIPCFKPTSSPYKTQQIQDQVPTVLPDRNRNVDVIPPTQSQYTSQQIQDQEPTFLPYRNRNVDEQKRFFNIWNEIHFIFYGFYFLEQVDHKLSTSVSFIEKACRYFLKKMKIILTMEFITQIENKQNILSINEDQWLEFIKESESLRQIIQSLKQHTLLSINVFEIDAYQQFQEDFNQNELSFQEKQLYVKIKASITPNIIEKSFQDSKVPYRLALKECYKDISSSINLTANMNEYARLQFMMICCMCIKSVFGPTRNESLVKVKENNGVSNLNSPKLIEMFLENASIENLQQQATMIEKFYF